MKHFIFVPTIAIAIIIAIFLPFVHGDHDIFAIGISTTVQFAAFASLLFVPIGLIWCLIDFLKRGKSSYSSNYPNIFRRISIGLSVVVILAASLGSFVSQNRFSAIIILLAGPFILSGINKRRKTLVQEKSSQYSITPYYFVLIPLSVIMIRLTLFNTIKNNSTDFVITQGKQLIEDIESYKKTNGHYPVSIQSTIEDYKTNVAGIDRFHYELNGDAYNLYFEQFSNMLGTEEIVMYNKLDEHEMTVHNQDLLRIPDQQIIRGYHQVVDLPQLHWKIFYFD